MTARAPRLIAGAAVFLILIGLAAFLIPPYASNWKLQTYVNSLTEDASVSKQPPEAIQTMVVNKAAALGLPVTADNVHVAVSSGSVKIDVLYVMQVNVAGYALDLHFRPGAGG